MLDDIFIYCDIHVYFDFYLLVDSMNSVLSVSCFVLDFTCFVKLWISFIYWQQKRKRKRKLAQVQLSVNKQVKEKQ